MNEDKARILLGVLVDFSESMKESLNLSKEGSTEQIPISRIHYIFSCITKILQKEHKSDEIFLLGFGLNLPKRKPQTIDILRMLRFLKRSQASSRDSLIRLLEANGAPYCKEYVRKYVSEEQGSLVHWLCKKNTRLLDSIVAELPMVCKHIELGVINSFVGFFVSSVKTNNAEKAEETLEKAYQLCVETLKKYELPTVIPVSEATEIVNKWATPTDTSDLSSLINMIAPMIFGWTPIRRALHISNGIFQKSDQIEKKKKILLLLTDGEATDGDIKPIASEMQKNVTVLVCLLSSKTIENPRRLYYAAEADWAKAHKDMLSSSSLLSNDHPALSILTDLGWELPEEGESRLFIHANNAEVIEEFTQVMHEFANNNYTLLKICSRVSLDIYINSAISEFEAKNQIGGTCYAHAVGTVLHLAMRRIHGRDGGYPKFETLRDELINEYGKVGASTENVLKEWSPKYKLKYKITNESGARKAINARRPVIATFRLFDSEWDDFCEFYKNNPQGILTKADFKSDKSGKVGGHAVVLMKINPDGLAFMNSWGTGWADKGVFKVEKANTLGDLGLKFFDVYWVLSDLTPEEKAAFVSRGQNIGDEFLSGLPDHVKMLPYECPNCLQLSPAQDYQGHFLQARCPKCGHTFCPVSTGLLLDYNTATSA